MEKSFGSPVQSGLATSALTSTVLDAGHEGCERAGDRSRIRHLSRHHCVCHHPLAHLGVLCHVRPPDAAVAWPGHLFRPNRCPFPSSLL